AEDAIRSCTEAGNEGQAARTRRQLGARVVEQDRASFRWNELVGARQDVAQVHVEPDLPLLTIGISARAYEEALDLLGRQGEDLAARVVARGHTSPRVILLPLQPLPEAVKESFEQA